MPHSLTIFAATNLIFIAVLLAAVVLTGKLWQRPRLALVQWVIMAALLLALSYAFGAIGGAIYNDPRPFTTSHVPPLVSHTPNNGFPSGHGLLAAALVALVATVDRWWTLPTLIMAVLVDWARVGAGIHRVVDMAGSSAAVALAGLVALLVTPVLMQLITPHLPADWKEQRLLSTR